MSIKPLQEIRQDNFEKLLREREIGTEAKIIFCGDIINVKLTARVPDDIFGSHPNNKIVSFAYLGTRRDVPPTIAINTWSVNTVDDSELIKIL